MVPPSSVSRWPGVISNSSSTTTAVTTLAATAAQAPCATCRRRERRDRRGGRADRKSTRLNSSHGYISYAVFCLKKKKSKSSTNVLAINDKLNQSLSPKQRVGRLSPPDRTVLDWIFAAPLNTPVVMDVTDLAY